MKSFKLFNNIVGWVICAIASAVYLSTIEPTASFWDCGEFIATAYKMEIGHPPGAPLFMLVGRVCSLFASDPSHVAMMINSLSALCSGFCIMFLFWTITHLARKMMVEDGAEISAGQTIAILGAGAVGALAYTFSDTFWFSAVEGEVYASSSLFTAVVFWCILKWEDCADKPYANRWLVCIAYLMGLSVGVHLLNLLTIPVLVLVYYYRKYENPTTKGALIALGISVFLLAAVLYGVIPGFAIVAGWFELFFVNVLSCSYNVGTLIYAVVLLGCLVWSIFETMKPIDADACKLQATDSRRIAVDKLVKRQHIGFVLSLSLLGIPFFGSTSTGHIVFGLILIVALIVCLIRFKDKINSSILNTIVICCTVLLLGYASYAALVIRSVSNPPMDENSPDDVFALRSYLNRDQYGDTPLLYGETYAAEYARVENGGRWAVSTDSIEPLYAKAIKQSPKEDDHYVLYDYKKKYNYCKEFLMPFPRMYSKQANHIAAYKEWAHIKGHHIRYTNMGQVNTAINPTFGENLVFFLKYQVGFMYWRYFMWNFVGRQNDIQGNGEVTHGNWCSGIPFIDNAMLGNQSNLPAELQNNRAHNTYYFLPFLLGIFGILYQFSRQKKGMQSFWLTFILFLLTGLAIVVYLNQTPYQPRERDYAYAGSFYAFCIWIGLGVLYITSWLERIIDKRIAATAATLLCLGVPALMAQQNWDDHDRSGRYTCRDFGADYLLSLAPNSVIFTNGDNDTFPLWYNQEVEGVGDDDRVANLSYLQMGWYVSQMKKDAYKSKALPLSLQEKDYMLGKLDVAYIADLTGGQAISIQKAMEYITSPYCQKQIKSMAGYDASDNDVIIIPSKHLYLEVDSAEAVNNSGAKPADIHNELESYRADLYKSDPVRYGTAAGFAELRRLKSYHMYIDISNKPYLGKHEIFILDLLANNHWKRPIYYAVTVSSDSYMGLDRYFRLEGLAYRIMPYSAGGRSDTDIMYNNMMNKFKFGNAADPKVYLEENNRRMATTFRHMFARLAADLANKGDQADKDKAMKVLDYCQKMIPASAVPHDYSSLSIADAYYALGQTAKGDAIASMMMDNSMQYINWIGSLNVNYRRTASQDYMENLQLLQSLGSMLKQRHRDALSEKCLKLLTNPAVMQNYQMMNASPEGQASQAEEEE